MSCRRFAQIGSTGSLPAFTVLVAILAYRGLTGLVPWRLRMDRTGRVPPGSANRTLGAVGSTPRGRPLPRDAHSPRRPDHARPLRARPRVRGGRHAPATRPVAPDDSAQVDRQPSCGRGVPGSSMRISPLLVATLQRCSACVLARAGIPLAARPRLVTTPLLPDHKRQIRPARRRGYLPSRPA